MAGRSLLTAPAVSGSAVGRADGPDFLCVGLQKAGTQWLYDQLQHHPDFWMPPIKELHFFDRHFPDGRVREAAKRYVERPDRYGAAKLRNEHAAVDERSAAFLKLVAAFDPRESSLEAYAGLFRAKGSSLSGDITPGYSTLPPKTIRAIARRLPDAKVCLMLREPAARLWSAWRMRCERDLLPWLTVRSFRRFRAFAERPPVVERSYPTVVAAKWAEAFPGRFRAFFLDDVIARPAETRAAILEFLGADPDAGTVVPPDFNRKAKSRAVLPGAAAQSYLREKFEAERERCADMFGGAAKDWPGRPY